MVTQVEIAKRIGLDVSSVNKILCQAPGPIFKKETIAMVFRVAKKLGYNFNRDTKHSLRRENQELKRALGELIEIVRGKAIPLTPDRVDAMAMLVDPVAEQKRQTG